MPLLIINRLGRRPRISDAPRLSVVPDLFSLFRFMTETKEWLMDESEGDSQESVVLSDFLESPAKEAKLDLKSDWSALPADFPAGPSKLPAEFKAGPGAVLPLVVDRKGSSHVWVARVFGNNTGRRLPLRGSRPVKPP